MTTLAPAVWDAYLTEDERAEVRLYTREIALLTDMRNRILKLGQKRARAQGVVKPPTRPHCTPRPTHRSRPDAPRTDRVAPKMAAYLAQQGERG